MKLKLESDSIENIVMDYITMLELHSEGWIDEQGNFPNEEFPPVVSAIHKAVKRKDEKQFILLKSILQKRLSTTGCGQ